MVAADVVRRIAGREVEKTTVDTSSNNRALAFCNQRKIARCSNGVIWLVFWNGTASIGNAWEFWFSEDEGESWSQNVGGSLGFDGVGNVCEPSISFFIDKDDYAHVVYTNRSDGYLYYARAAPNEDCTAWTWQTPVNITYADPLLAMADITADVVAHRHGSGWQVHIVSSQRPPGYSHMVMYYRIPISNTGEIDFSFENVDQFDISESWINCYPSIDFHHTGDCKTVDGEPDLYVAWSSPEGVSSKGIKFKKAEYSGGEWNWRETRNIAPALHVSGASRWLNCIYDGWRVLIAGRLTNNAGEVECRLWDRNEEDTFTALKSDSQNFIGSNGSLSFDEYDVRNVYILSQDGDKWQLARWDRSDERITFWDVTKSGANTSSFGSLKRGYSGDRIEFVFSDHGSAPYNIKFGGKET